MQNLMAFVGLAAISGVAASDCEFQAERGIALDGREMQRLEIEVGAGALRITGSDREGVRGTVTLCTSEEELLDEFELITYDGEEARIEIDAPDWSRRGWGDHYALAHVDLEVPHWLALDIDDGSGGMVLTNVGDVVIDDGSGSIEIVGAGDVVIEDGSGSITIRDAAGHVELDDGSGGIEVIGAASVRVVDDGSGEIRLSSIRGDAIVEEDGSGSIHFEDIAGRALVERDGSGSVHGRNIAGEFHYPGMRR